MPVTLRGARSVLRGGQWFPRLDAAQVTVSTRLFAKQDRFDTARAAILAGCGEPDLSGEATLLEGRRTTPRSM
ncbi:MAG: hypothetical protein OXI64_11270 [Defluviicoccus sp.]|nr:hypothetical protein [Defluviicoccus sp.]